MAAQASLLQPLRASVGIPRPPSMSERWLGLSWDDHLPWELGSLTVELATLDLGLEFVRRHYADLLPARPDQRFLADPMTPAKRRFYAEADVFLLRETGRPVGIQIGHPTDWSTYYVRTVALLPHMRGKGIIAALTERMAAPLQAAGIQRIEGDVPPANVANLLAQTRLGYVATGTLNTERWGTMLRLTRYLSDEADDAFRTQFCAGTWPRSRKLNPQGQEGAAP